MDAVNRAPLTRPPAVLFMTSGTMICQVFAEALTYFHLVVSDKATAYCERGVERIFRQAGLSEWRAFVIHLMRMPKPNSHFPGSTESTLYVIHPEASP
ncbi:hypothetical protein [Streptomyces eurocidicus]|nr:hypothetical protein [Streptomyces eurocidicus]